MTDDEPLPAGAFPAWLAGIRRALRGDAESEVPCGTCTACCTSAQFVHIGPDEAATLARIPTQLLFPAPRLPHGHVLLGYDENGHCPMLVDGACSIYEHRPRTCRTYDCRIFPATAVEPEDQPAVAERARQWRFDFPDGAGRIEQQALKAAARFVGERGDVLPEGAPPSTAAKRAALAVELHDAFLARDHEGAPVVVEPDYETVRAIADARRPGFGPMF